MTDRTERLKEALEKPLAKLPLRRHHDDNYWDEIIVYGGQVTLHGTTVYRYKTSGLSGDEWRTSARLVVKQKGVAFDGSSHPFTTAIAFVVFVSGLTK